MKATAVIKVLTMSLQWTPNYHRLKFKSNASLKKHYVVYEGRCQILNGLMLNFFTNLDPYRHLLINIKVNYGNTRTMSETYSRLTMKI